MKIFVCLLAVLWLTGCQESDDPTLSTSSTVIRVAAVGDSITEGYLLDDPATQSYPVQLASMLGSGWDVANFGKANKTLLWNGDDPYRVSSAYEASLAFLPHIVVIMLGINDLKTQNRIYKDNFVSDYVALIESYKNLSSRPKVYICTPPPVYHSLSGITNENLVKELIPRVYAAAQEANVEVIDIYTWMLDKPEYFIDGIHPSFQGAEEIAKKIYETIKL